jgi:hypothetical protein
VATARGQPSNLTKPDQVSMIQLEKKIHKIHKAA